MTPYFRDDGAVVAFPEPLRPDLLAEGWNFSGREGAHVTASPDGTPAWNPYQCLAEPGDYGPEVEARLRPYREAIALADALDGPDPGVEFADGKALLPFQRAGVLRGIQQRRLIIADEPGLGKTQEAIGIIAGLRPERTLIIAPASVGAMWRARLREWLIDPPIVQLITSGRQAVHPAAGIVIASYALAGKPAIQEARWDALICDEAHALKNPKAKRTRDVLKGIGARTDVFLALTGTPMPNRPAEVYELARVIDHAAIDFLSRDRFLEAYDQDSPYGGSNITGRTKELSARLRASIMTRRAKLDVIDELPPLSVELVEIDTAQTRAAVKAEKTLDLDISGLNLHVPIDGAVSTIRKEMGDAKVKPAIQFIKDLIEGGDRVFAIAHHKSVIEELSTALGAKVLTGSTPQAQRQPIVDEFASGAGDALVAQMQVGGLGLDGLQLACSVVVIVEPSWVPGDNDQAIDRLFRVGQLTPVRAYMLAAPGSIDERIVGRAVEKARVIHSALDGSRPIG